MRPAPASSSGDVFERLLDDLLGLLDRLRRDVLQREPAERKRHAGPDALPVHLGEFERAAAEVADDAVRPVEAGDHAERGQLRLALAGEHVDLDAADALGLRDEGRAVLGVAAGRGRDPPKLADLHAVAQRAKAPERGQRLLDRVGGQQPVVCTSRPSPASTFSLKIGVGCASSPS